jgi:hypothetical protein
VKRVIIALLLGIWAVVGPACHKGVLAMNEKKDGGDVDRRIEKLRDVITLPAAPTEVWFQQVPLGKPGGLGPTDYLLVAVIRFQPADLARITSSAQPRPGSPPRISTAANRPWLPEPVRAAIHPFDDRSVTIRGSKFDASVFAKSPFLSGTFVALEGGEWVLLVLQTS